MGIPSLSTSTKLAATGPQSERDFIHALRDSALFAVDLTNPGPVPGLTAPELVRHSRLSRPSVTSLLSRFAPILEGQAELGGKPVGQGRPRRWAIDPDIGVVIGVTIGQEGQVAMSDLYGQIQHRHLLKPSKSADKTIEQVVELIQPLLGERPVTDVVVGVGMSLEAPVERDKGVRLDGHLAHGRASESMWSDWQLMRVQEHLRAHLSGWDDVPVLLDNDANLGALAEYIWGAARPSRDRAPYENVVYIEWSRGIGAGLILGRQLYRGEGVAGEIGHTIVREGDAPSCPRCGNTGCLEAVAGWEAVLRKLEDYKDADQLGQEDLVTALKLAADQPDSPAGRAFRTAAQIVGHVLGPVIHFLNPELVIIGGDIGQLGYNVIRTPLRDSLKRYTMRPALADVTIVPARLTGDSALQGALALVLRQSPGDPDSLLAFLQGKSAA